MIIKILLNYVNYILRHSSSESGKPTQYVWTKQWKIVKTNCLLEMKEIS